MSYLSRPSAVLPRPASTHRRQRSALLLLRGTALWYRNRGHAIARQLAKRAIDIIVSSVALVALLPLLLLTAVAILLESRGPLLFAQTRVGRFGRTFRMYKLRSMRANAEAEKSKLAALNENHGGPTFKIRRDPRITRVGRLIRKLSIDELPQLWNVLRGDMTLVGPRPALPKEVATYTLHERQRLDVKPGITCIWQVSGRSNLCFAEQVELDIEYIKTRSLRTDVKLLVATVPAVISGRGAY